jgi:insulysin
MAGYSFEIQNTVNGMQLSILGYNNKLWTLMEKILEEMKNLVIDPKRFEILKGNSFFFFIFNKK